MCANFGRKTGFFNHYFNSPWPLIFLKLFLLVVCWQIPVIYYDSSDDAEEVSEPAQPTVTSYFQPGQPLMTTLPGPHHLLERASEFDVQTPESPDLPMADADLSGNGSADTSLTPRPCVGLSGTIV